MTTRNSARRHTEKSRRGAAQPTAQAADGAAALRNIPSERNRIYGYLIAGFWIIAPLLLLITFRDYGITYDEPKDHEYGRLLWRFYLSGFKDQSLFGYYDLKIYGGLFELAASAFCNISPMDEYQTRHLLNSAVGLLGVVGCYRIGMLLGGRGAALLSALLLVTFPEYWGHMFNNPKDIPYAAGYIWSLYFILISFLEFPRIGLFTSIKLGIAIGLTLAIRVGGIILFPYYAIGIILGTIIYGRMAIRKYWLNMIVSAMVPLIVAWAVMAMFWPYALLRPLAAPLEALLTFSRFGWTGDILFGGRFYSASALPIYYVPRFLMIKTPEILIPILAGGAWLGIRTLARKEPARRLLTASPYLVMVTSILAPIIYVVAVKSVAYNGMRHFIFLLPPIACLGGICTSLLIEAILKKNYVAGRAAIGILVTFIVWHVSIIIRLHPQQMVYYNQFVGGLQGAFNSYELDYWGNSYKELTERFSAKLEREYGQRPPVTRIWVNGPYNSAKLYFPDYCRLASAQADAGFAFFLINTSRPPRMSQVYAVVQRFGVPLAYALDLRSRAGIDNIE